MVIKYLSCFALVITLLGLTACSEEASAPKAPDAMPTTQPATQPALDNAASLLQMATADATAVNKVCPISGEPIDPNGKKINFDGMVCGFCCDDCLDAFKAEPEKHAGRLH